MHRVVVSILAGVPVFVHAAPEQSAPEQSQGWSAYGGDPGGARYSSLREITAKNVGELKVAWTFRTGELGQGVKDWRRSAFEATPILYNGTLNLTTTSTDVIALNAPTDALRYLPHSHTP